MCDQSHIHMKMILFLELFNKEAQLVNETANEEIPVVDEVLVVDKEDESKVNVTPKHVSG